MKQLARGSWQYKVGNSEIRNPKLAKAVGKIISY